MVVLHKLIEALRTELQQYGEMLAVLENQNELVRTNGNGPASVSAINLQGEAIHAARQSRLNLQRELACDLNCRPDATFAEMLPALPANYQPLISALIQENNELLVSVRERARQNQALLQRSVRFMENFISGLSSLEQASPNVPAPAVVLHASAPIYDAIK